MAAPKDNLTTYEEIVLHYEQLDMDDDERTYEQVVRLYDLAENMFDALEDTKPDSQISNGAEQFAIIQNAATQTMDSADIISQEFAYFARQIHEGEEPDMKMSGGRINSAVRKFFAEMDKVNEGFQELAKREGNPEGIENQESTLGPTRHDPWGPLRGGMLDSYHKLTEQNGALMLEAAMHAITHMVVLTERLEQAHDLGAYSSAVPDRNYRQPNASVKQQKIDEGWAGIKKDTKVQLAKDVENQRNIDDGSWASKTSVRRAMQIENI